MSERAEKCTGAHDCTVAQHIHGCYADRGECDAPEEHAGRRWGNAAAYRRHARRATDVC